MAEFAFLSYYKDHPADKALQKDNQGFSYAKLHQRGSLSPVLENEVFEEQKKAKRRFSLDLIFSKKKKDYKLPKDVRRNTTASTNSIDSTSGTSSTPNSAPGSRKGSAASLKVSRAEIAAWCFS